MSLTVGHLYPEHLNIYADRGNIAVLRRRCEWRGIEFTVVECGPGDRTPKADLYYLGGGQDRDQLLIADDLLARTADLRAAVDDGAGVLAVCGGYQLLGHGYRGHQGDEMPGTGLVDLTTVAGPTRMIGNITLRCELDPGDQRTLVGFENHAGRTTWGRASSRWDASCGATATTARTAARASTTARSSAPTCTGRCCPRTRGWPTG